jgi:chemotaxis response regulator CheB
MLRDILEETIAQQRDMELVRDVTPRARPTEQQPDVVIIGTSAPRDASGPTDVLERWPRSHILMIATSGNEAVMYELQQRQTPLGEMSPAGLVDAIRAAYASSVQRRARQT